jgi:hypothetical protein
MVIPLRPYSPEERAHSPFLGLQNCLRSYSTTSPWSDSAYWPENTVQRPPAGEAAKCCLLARKGVGWDTGAVVGPAVWPQFKCKRERQAPCMHTVRILIRCGICAVFAQPIPV